MDFETRSPAVLTPNSQNAFVRRLDRYFSFSSRGSTFGTEILAGLTTFSTLSYVLVVNPLILADAGMERGALITVTALVAALFTVIMGLRTNYPLAMAPRMGVNAYVAVQVCQGMHIPWQAALGMVFYSGLLFLAVSATGLRRKILESFPDNFKKTVGTGIGFFIAFLGLKNAGIIAANPLSLVSLGSFASPVVMLGFAGVLLAIALVYRRVPGALVISIVVLTIAGLFLPGTAPHARITQIPARVLSLPKSIGPVFLKLDLLYVWRHPAQCVPIVLTLLFSDLFSAMAVLLAIGAVFGTTTTIIYIESAAGVEQGGRTGLTSISTAICFLSALFLTPLIAVIPPVATAPALVMVGIFMMQGFNDLNLRDGVIAATAVVTVLLMVLASASDGLALWFITNILVLALVGRRREVKPFGYVLMLLFLIHYVVN